MTNKPKVGDHIYLPSSPFHSSPPDNETICGGKATVSKITSSYGERFVEVEELPSHSFHLGYLLLQQEALKKEFGKEKASLDRSKRCKQILVSNAKVSIKGVLNALDDLPYFISTLPDLFDKQDTKTVESITEQLKLLRGKLQ